MEKKIIHSVSRRRFLGTAALATAGLAFAPTVFASAKGKPNSKFGGVQIGAITYSWRSMPSSAEDILKYCVDAGISSIELMGDVAENYAGIPAGAPRPQRGVEMSDAEKAEFQKKVEQAKQAQRDWRLSLSMDKYKALRKMYNNAGVNIHIVKFSPSNWSDEEIDYAFKSAKVMGAGGITNEIGEAACERLGKFAEKHNMYAIFHNHAQPGESDFSFDKFLAYSPKNMLNFDAGHYFGATGKQNGTPPNTNMPWGKGDTPIADMLKLVQKNKWPIYFDIELEYDVPENSDAQKEVKKCVEYCRNILA